MRRSGTTSSAPADFDDIDFIPVQFNFDDEPPPTTAAASGEHEFKIVFRPKPELLKKANEPLYIIRELRKLGTLDLVAETDRLPPLAELEADRPYLGWTGTLRTAGYARADRRGFRIRRRRLRA